jgi:DNA mismatch repair protein MutS
MYKKYYDVWATHAAKYGSKVALLYQVGGFFEIYDTENLVTGTTQVGSRQIAEICQLSLTAHPVSADLQTLFGGFPEAALSKFERILVHAGFTVVVVVQKKGTAGNVEDRVVDHIASPGCYVDGAGERRLVGCVLESIGGGSGTGVHWAATAIDIATGRIWFVEGAGGPDRLHQFLCMYPPSELVIWSDGGAAAAALTDMMREATAAVTAHIKCLAPSAAAIEESILESIWPAARIRLEWMGRMPQARRCVAALMEFAREHVPSSLRAIGLPEPWIANGEVRLGNAALEQLGVLSLHSEKQSLIGLLDCCRSVAGRRLMRARLLRPIYDVGELTRRLDLVAHATEVATTKDGVTERNLRSLYDMSRLWRRLELGSASMGDLACLLRSYEAATALGTVWPSVVGAEFMSWILSRWSPAILTELARAGRVYPVEALPFHAAGRAPAVEALFAEGLAIRGSAVALCATWSGLGRAEGLFLDDAEGGGFRITGTKRRISAVLTVLRDGGDLSATMVLYKTTASLETSELASISARHRTWYAKWSSVWASFWQDAQAEIVGRSDGAAQGIEAWCAEVDLSWTVAAIAGEWNWVRPVFAGAAAAAGAAAESSISVQGLRHPILERLTTVPYVSHAIDLGSGSSGNPGAADRGLLLYGMNASGKSSLMKAIGLCCLLAQTGFPVPAVSCTLRPFKALFTRILGNDNLWAGQSSFVVEMTELREILRFADAESLVLGDELCKGTESLSATALVAASVETLTARGTKFVFATHLHELATLPDIVGLAGVRPVHLRVSYDAAADRLIYGRDLDHGAGSALYGLEVCRALALPAGYLDRATALRQSLSGWKAPQTSAYSTAAVVDACAVCSGSGSGSGLEMHHIVPQKDAAAAAAAGIHMHGPGNLVCLCSGCHDDHHAGRLVITGWQDTSEGRLLMWNRVAVAAAAAAAAGPEVTGWIREQRAKKIRVATIQRMATQIFGVSLSEKEIKAMR